MPYEALKPCRHPACGAIVSDGSGFCAAHAGDRNQSRRRYEATRVNDESTRLRRGQRWRKLSELVRAQQPTCSDPFGTHARDGLPAYSAQVHHVQGADAHPELIFEVTNLAAICTACHGKIEAAEKRGEETAHLFVGKTAQPPTCYFA